MAESGSSRQLHSCAAPLRAGPPNGAWPQIPVQGSLPRTGVAPSPPHGSAVGRRGDPGMRIGHALCLLRPRSLSKTMPRTIRHPLSRISGTATSAIPRRPTRAPQPPARRRSVGRPRGDGVGELTVAFHHLYFTARPTDASDGLERARTHFCRARRTFRGRAPALTGIARPDDRHGDAAAGARPACSSPRGSPKAAPARRIASGSRATARRGVLLHRPDRRGDPALVRRAGTAGGRWRRRRSCPAVMANLRHRADCGRRLRAGARIWPGTPSVSSRISTPADGALGERTSLAESLLALGELGGALDEVDAMLEGAAAGPAHADQPPLRGRGRDLRASCPLRRRRSLRDDGEVGPRFLPRRLHEVHYRWAAAALARPPGPTDAAIERWKRPSTRPQSAGMRRHCARRMSGSPRATPRSARSRAAYRHQQQLTGAQKRTAVASRACKILLAEGAARAAARPVSSATAPTAKRQGDAHAQRASSNGSMPSWCGKRARDRDAAVAARRRGGEFAGPADAAVQPQHLDR